MSAAVDAFTWSRVSNVPRISEGCFQIRWRGRPAAYLFSVAQIFNLSVSPDIAARREDFSNAGGTRIKKDDNWLSKAETLSLAPGLSRVWSVRDSRKRFLTVFSIDKSR